MLDTRPYEVTFHDGHVSEYAANVIIENIYQQVDSEGNIYMFFKEIMDHRNNGTQLDEPGRKTTKGWYLQVFRKDSSTSWESLRDLKESNPMEVAEYAFSNQIHNEPAFSWWVSHTLKKRNHFISTIKARRKKKDFKFGIEVPTSVERALQID
jgi:hypothetical protein